MLPTSSASPGTLDADVLAHANDELQSRLVPLVMATNEEYFTFTVDVPLVGGQAIYRVPDRCAGSKLRELTLLVGATIIDLPRIEPERLSQLVNGASGVPAGFVMEAGGVRLVPTPTSGGMSLRMRYFVRPGQLTATAADFALIVTAGTVPLLGAVNVVIASGGLMPTGGDGNLYDIVCGRPPFEVLVMDATCFSAVSTTLVLEYSLGSSASVQGRESAAGFSGADYVTKRDLSPIVQLPVELHSLLAQRTVCRILQSLGQYDKLDRAEKEADRLERVALSLLTPRVDGAPRKLRGLLQNTRRGGWLGF
jgi:hypothetical protein